jgi:hypothetical protein
MTTPTTLALGQVWQDTIGDLHLIHRSPTGKNLRALRLRNMCANEVFGIPATWRFVCVLDGSKLLYSPETESV